MFLQRYGLFHIPMPYGGLIDQWNVCVCLFVFLYMYVCMHACMNSVLLPKFILVLTSA